MNQLWRVAFVFLVLCPGPILAQETSAGPFAKFGEAVEKKLECGASMVHLPVKTPKNLLFIRIKFLFGSAANLQGKIGQSTLLPHVLGATKSRSASDFNMLMLRQHKTSVNFRGGPGELSCDIEAPASRIGTVMYYVSDAIGNPAFTDANVDAAREKVIGAYDRAAGKTSNLLRTKFIRTLRPEKPGSPLYELSAGETAEEMRTVSGESLTRFHKDFLNIENCHFTVIGQVELENLMPWIEGMSKELQGGNASEALKYSVGDSKVGADSIPNGDSRLGLSTTGKVLPIGPAHPDYPAMLIATRILGGRGKNEKSRLTAAVERVDAAAEATATLLPFPHGDRAELMIDAFCLPRSIIRMKKIIDVQLVLLFQEGVSAAEVKAAQQSYAYSQMQRLRVDEKIDEFSFSSNAVRLARLIEDTSVAGRNMASLQELEDAVGRVDAAAVNRAIRKHMNPGSYYTVYTKPK